jgi:shikimate 5-dehydrogenase
VAEAGAAEVVVVARRPEMAAAAASLAGPAGRTGTTDEADAADVIVNATPMGMAGVVALPGVELALPVPPERLAAGQLVVDLVYEPLLTPFLAAAKERGAGAVNGLGMLIHQAARAFRLWTGEDPALEAMSAAALAELGRRRD